MSQPTRDPESWEEILRAQGVTTAQIDDAQRAAAKLTQALDAVPAQADIAPDCLTLQQILQRLAQSRS